MKKILLLLLVLSLIPCLGYSQHTTQKFQKQTLQVNQYQLQCILRNRLELEYLKKDQLLSDSLLAEQEFRIKNLKEQIVSYNKINIEKQVDIDKWKSYYNQERRKNRLILISSGVVVGIVSYLYISK